MNNKLLYKGYTGSIEISLKDSCLHGKILFIEDIITYEGSTVEEIQETFQSAVDRYLEYCAKTCKPANKPYSGSFNVRVGQKIHREAAKAAYNQNISLNKFVAKAIENTLQQSGIEQTLNKG